MDETLSSLIAFVGFLIVFSMLIQSVQEAFKNLFKLKAGVWERFFINLYSTDFKKKSSLKGKPFWKRFNKGEFVGEFEQRLLRLKTIVIKVDDQIKDTKQTLAEIIAIKSNEFDQKDLDARVGLLYEKNTLLKDFKIETMLKVYDKKNMLSIPNSDDNKNNGKKIKPIAQFAEIFGKLYVNFTNREGLDLKTAQTKCKEFQTTLMELEQNISTYRVQIENKIDSWLVQLEGEYKKNMFYWTLYISIAAVLILNADTFTIYKYFSINSKAQEVIIENITASVSHVSKIQANDLNEINDAIKKNDFQKAKTRLTNLSEQFAREYKKIKAGTKENTANEILASVKKLEKKSDPELNELKNQFGKLTDLYVDLQKESIDYHMDTLSAAGIPLGWEGDWEAYKKFGGDNFLAYLTKKFFGLLITLFLVSFGAPFWKNIMNALIGIKNLSAKKPVS